MAKKVLFIKDFANKKKDEEFECDSMLASQLVNNDKVAVYVDSKSEKEKAKKKSSKK